MGFLGMDCNVFGTRKNCSGNIFVSQSYNFFNHISFCRFSNFKNLSSPELALFQGVSCNFYILSRVTEDFVDLLTS